jgi:hypothetical protein
MSVDINLLATLSNASVLDVFKDILKFRICTRYELENEKQTYDIKELSDALEKLQSAGLIDKKSAAIEAFDKFYPTEEGLFAEKIVK